MVKLINITSALTTNSKIELPSLLHVLVASRDVPRPGARETGHEIGHVDHA